VPLYAVRVSEFLYIFDAYLFPQVLSTKAHAAVKTKSEHNEESTKQRRKVNY